MSDTDGTTDCGKHGDFVTVYVHHFIYFVCLSYFFFVKLKFAMCALNDNIFLFIAIVGRKKNKQSNIRRIMSKVVCTVNKTS